MACRIEKGAGRRPTPAVLLRRLVISETVLVAAVVVGIAWEPLGDSGLDKGIANLGALAQRGDVERAAASPRVPARAASEDTVPLSEHEQRQFEQIEQALRAGDPRFADAIQAANPRVRYKRRITMAALSINWDRKDGAAVIALKVLSLFAGVWISIQSGSRGGWIAIPVVAVIWAAFAAPHISAHQPSTPA